MPSFVEIDPPVLEKKIFEGFLPYDSSSLTNEKDHHYFLNSADVCW